MTSEKVGLDFASSGNGKFNSCSRARTRKQRQLSRWGKREILQRPQAPRRPKRGPQALSEPCHPSMPTPLQLSEPSLPHKPHTWAPQRAELLPTPAWSPGQLHISSSKKPKLPPGGHPSCAREPCLLTPLQTSTTEPPVHLAPPLLQPPRRASPDHTHSLLPTPLHLQEAKARGQDPPR